MSMKNGFWQHYHAIVAQKQVSPQVAAWYVRWARAFEHALPGVPLQERTQEDVQAYLQALARQHRYQDWQLEQANDALRLLFAECLTLPWARSWPVMVPKTAPKEPWPPAP
ncbi:hypothetical protein D6833_06205, partial [Candidatus Parcubacteria bacterium]